MHYYKGMFRPSEPKYKAFIKGQWVTCSKVTQKKISGEQRKQKDYLGQTNKVRIGDELKISKKQWHCFAA